MTVVDRRGALSPGRTSSSPSGATGSISAGRTSTSSTSQTASSRASGGQVVERSADVFLDLFGFATLPFYSGRFEPVRGQPDTARIRTAARWLVDRGCLVKGHPLCWHTVTADWLTELPVDEVIDAQLARIRRDVGDFAGLVDTWDVINEVVIMPVFDRGENGITQMAQRLGRVRDRGGDVRGGAGDQPRATLLLNDFDMSADYERLIEDCLEAGIRIDALGLQSHMHQGYWGVEKTLDVLERFSRFGLPLHFTETHARLRPPDAAGDRRPQRLPGDRVADDAGGRGAPGRRGRDPLSDPAGAPGCRGDHVVGLPRRRLAQRPDRPRPRGRLARSPPTSGSSGSSRASGGCSRRRCAPTTTGASGSPGSSATTRSRPRGRTAGVRPRRGRDPIDA